jgi:S-adenosylmethionine hydrolase
LPDSQRVKVEGDLKAYAITKSEYWRKPVSNTFHGRDIFAPVAARLSLGMMAASLGDNIDTLTAFPIPHPFRDVDGITGHVQHIDNFGNLITDINEKDLPTPARQVIILFRDQVIRGIMTTYAEGEGPLAIFGSSGYLEIAVAAGSAADFFKARIGDEVKAKSKPGD